VRFLVVLLWAYALLAIGCLGYVVFTYLFAFGPRREGSRRGRLMTAALKELAATLLLMPLYPLWWVIGASYESAIEGEGDGRVRRPVVLLHGFAMNRTNWVWLGRRLAAHGVAPLYATSYFSLQTVQQSARHLAEFIEHVIAREDATGVDIVAHSLGGVVARYYLEHMGGARKVGKLVTIASPHKGTHLGRLGLVPSARDLTHGSSVMSLLCDLPDGCPYTSIWSSADAVVVPPESSSIAPLGCDRVFDDLGHLSLLLSPRVADAVIEALR
jgi:triacylglycerol esterase/lipase EstA (alpha/beta hydrolase family)